MLASSTSWLKISAGEMCIRDRISEAYVQYLTQFVFDLNSLCEPVFTHVQQALETNTLLNTIEKENLLRLEAQAQSVHEQLLPCLLYTSR